MLLELKVKNFKSFGEQQVFSPLANKKIIKKKDSLIEIEKNLKLLPTVAIYGANASGKSNLLQALTLLNKPIKETVIKPFLLDGEEYKNNPSEFIFSYFLDGVFIEYEIHISSSLEIVFEKFDLIKSKTKAINIYTRKDENIYIIPFLGNDEYKQTIKQLTGNKNFMFKVIVDNSGHDFSLEAKEVIDTMNKLITKSLDDKYFYNEFNSNTLYRDKINKIISKMDLSIHEVSIKKFDIDISDMKSNLLKDLFKDKSKIEYETPLFKHIDNKGNSHYFDEDQVSTGTINLFRIMFRVVYCLDKGLPIFIDELEKTLHPILCRKILEMFNNKIINKKGAQLIFTTHNVDLLDESVFRKDQIYFVEKNENQMSQIFSLNDFKSRNGEDIKTRYMNDRYGAIPNISDLEDIFNDEI